MHGRRPMTIFMARRSPKLYGHPYKSPTPKSSRISARPWRSHGKIYAGKIHTRETKVHGLSESDKAPGHTP